MLLLAALRRGPLPDVCLYFIKCKAEAAQKQTGGVQAVPAGTKQEVPETVEKIDTGEEAEGGGTGISYHWNGSAQLLGGRRVRRET